MLTSRTVNSDPNIGASFKTLVAENKSFAIIALIMLVTGAVGVVGINNVSKITSDIFFENVQPSEKIIEINELMVLYRVKIYEQIASIETDEEVDIELKSLSLFIDEKLEFQSALFLTEQEKREFDELLRLWREIKLSYLMILELSYNYAKEEALEAIAGDNLALSELRQKTASRLIELKSQGIEDAYHSSQSIKTWNVWLTFVALIVGIIVCFVIVARFNRKIRRYTQELREFNRSLEEKVKQRTNELQLTVGQVEEKNQMLESLSSQLSKYLSPQVYESIFSGKQEVKIASRRTKLTVFFSDIVGFTETTDNLEAEELSNLLNHYLTEMSEIALEYGATIDKYIGDAMLLFFGDPETKGARKDAKRCVLMAIAMQRRMRELEQVWRDKGLEQPFEVRIGIATGFCTVGNFGSQARMDYTIIGNEVNLAARLESSAPPGGILIAHETYSLIKNSVMAEEQPPLTVKGFDKPIHCYKVEGVLDDLAGEGKVIREEQDGVKVLVDLTKRDKSSAIRIIKKVLSQLEDLE